jgi:hypothetical protein
MCRHLLYPDQLLIQCSNFRCCGSTLTSLHELLDHFETTHVLLSNQHGWPTYPMKAPHCQMALQFPYVPPGLALVSPTTHRTEHEWHAHVYALDAPVDTPAPPSSLSTCPSSFSYLKGWDSRLSSSVELQTTETSEGNNMIHHRLTPGASTSSPSRRYSKSAAPGQSNTVRATTAYNKSTKSEENTDPNPKLPKTRKPHPLGWRERPKGYHYPVSLLSSWSGLICLLWHWYESHFTM